MKVRILSSIVAMVASLVVAGLGVQDAQACAVFAATSEPAALMDAQRILVVWKDDRVEIHNAISATQIAGGAAWVMPVRTEPILSVGDRSVFEALERDTAPLIIEPSYAGVLDSDGCGGSVDAGANAAPRDAVGGVVPLQKGQVGDYEYAVVSTKNASDMAAWLIEEGYQVPEGAAARLQEYVDAGYLFVWAKLAPGADGRAPAPLILEMKSPPDRRLPIPMKLAALTAEGRLPFLAYVMGEKRYRLDGYGAMDLQNLADAMAVGAESGEAFAIDPALDILTDAAGGRLAVTEYSLALNPESSGLDASVAAILAGAEQSEDGTVWLTRIYARTPVEFLEDGTITYAFEAPEVEPIVTANRPVVDASAAWLLAIAGLIVFRRRRQV